MAPTAAGGQSDLDVVASFISLPMVAGASITAWHGAPPPGVASLPLIACIGAATMLGDFGITRSRDM